MPDRPRTAPAFLWHPDVHLSWAGEHLYFWRLSFYPGFDSTAIASALTETLEEMDVRSYAAREMFGTVDVVLRAWLPISVSESAFSEALVERLKSVDLNLVDSFDVKSVRHQWNWSSGAPRRLHGFDSLAGLEPDALESTSLPSGTLDVLENHGLILRTARDIGITFVMAIGGKIEVLEPGERRRLSNLLVGIVEGSERVAEQALYEGTGFADYLFVGRVDGNEINEVTQLGLEIMNSARRDGFEIKTTTMISHPLEVLVHREELPARAELSPWTNSNLEEALLSGEDAMTEIREAVFTPGYGMAPTSEQGDASLELTASFFRSVASFLNSRGGLIVIGAILRDARGLEKSDLEGIPVVGDYLCVGVDADLGQGDWAEYETRLEKLLEFHIDPSPTQWIEIDHEFVEGRLMVTVQVLKPDEGIFFFAGGSPQSAESFFIRRGETTIELNRSDADAYRRIDSATGSLSAADWGVVRALRRQRRLDRYQLASLADMSVADTESALERLVSGGYVALSVGSDEIKRYALDPHWSGTGTPPQRQKSAAS